MFKHKGLVDLKFYISLGRRISFYFRGNKNLSRGFLINYLRSEIKNNFSEINLVNIKNSLIKLYRSRGYYRSEINGRDVVGTTLQGIKFRNFYFHILTGTRLTLRDVSFRGRKFFSRSY